MNKHKTYVRLIENSYPFKKGTEFIATGGDDGMWSGYAFHSGTVFFEGKEYIISVERNCCEYLKPKEYTGKAIMSRDFTQSREMTDQEFWDEWLNSPG